MSALAKRKRSLDDSSQLRNEASSSGLVKDSQQEPTSVFSNISANDQSHQHVGHVYNTTNFNCADSGDADAKRVIDGLYFRDIERRRDAIERPTDHTYEWLLRPDSPVAEPLAQARELIGNEVHVPDYVKKDESQRFRSRRKAATRFENWLRTGNGLFWIVGKAASGKSTLMKHLRHDDKVSQLLTEWSNRSQVVIVDHYFWHSGSDLQKSHEGLYRSLLWQIFRSDPQLVRIAWPKRFNAAHLTRLPNAQEFCDALTNLSNYGIKLSLFVDGLDEYHPQNDLDLLLETFTTLAKLDNIKVLLSCRPWQVFEEHLQETQNTIRMDEVNWIDIQLYAVKTIRRHLRGSVLKSDFLEPLSSKGARFIEDFVRTAQGVFLWAHLVLQRLSPRIQFIHNIEELHAMMARSPSELET